MKIGKYLFAIAVVSAIWGCLDLRSSARGLNLKLPIGNFSSPANASHRRSSTFAQALSSSDNSAVSKDFRVEIGIAQNSSDKSLLNVKGSIDNNSDRSYYVYYIVAKFVSKDIAIKQAIIPVNSRIAPGASASFDREISTQLTDPISLATVKPVVVKYEYR